jgi:sirohydrochlorin ferrochelatase
VTTGYILFAHGSPVASANEAVRAVASGAGLEPMLAAFLEQGRPNLDEAVASLAAAGIQRIAVIPYFLTLGLNMQRDLPRIIERLALRHPDVDIRVTQPLDGHPALAAIVRDRAGEAFDRAEPS